MAAAKFQNGLLVLMMAILFLIITSVCYCGASHSPTSTTTSLLLERIGSLNHSEVLARDVARHMQIFQTAIGGVVDFPLLGSPPPSHSGCTDQVSGHITELQAAPDGIFGLGHQRISIISQLSSRGITPSVFSHCLKGADKGGGGTLVLGEVVEPGMIYSPLVLSQPHYNLNLISISINRQTVSIPRKVFATSRNRGTVVDSGTTLAFLAEEAYDPFVIALAAAVPPSVRSFPCGESHCFLVSSSVFSLRDVFPLVSLNFEGDASIVLKPEGYLLQCPLVGRGVLCIGFRKNRVQKSLTILGELVLKDKIVVYDLARQRLGWVDYDCSSAVNVSLTPPGKYVSSSSRDAAVLNPWITIATTGFIVMFAFMCTSINY